MHAALPLVIVLTAGGCDRVFGLRDLREEAPTIDAPRSDAPQPKDAAVVDTPRPPDARIDAAAGCSPIGLACAGVTTVFSCGSRCFVACQEAVAYATAQQRCTAWNGTLAVLDDATEASCVAAKVPAGAHWIGMTQASTAASTTEGWVWSTGAAATGQPWYTGGGEPNDGGNNEAGREQCGWLANVGWGDGVCSSGFLLMCERAN